MGGHGALWGEATFILTNLRIWSQSAYKEAHFIGSKCVLAAVDFFQVKNKKHPLNWSIVKFL